MIVKCFNHFAQVAEGRVGPDVAFGDSKPSFLKEGPKMAVTKKAALLTTAAAFEDQLTRLAADAHPAVRKTIQKLAMDAKKAADEMDEDEVAEDAALMEGKDCAKDKAKDKAKDRAKDEKEEDDDEEFEPKKAKDKSKDKMRAKDEKEEDEDEEEEDDDKKKKAEDKRAKDRKAMDEAISAAILANDQKHRNIAEARATVRPILGDVLAMDDAEEIYRLGCETQGIDLAGVPKGTAPSVYRTLLGVAKRAAPTPQFANDSASGDVMTRFMKDFPTASIPRRA
jgi:hypothetical protein